LEQHNFERNSKKSGFKYQANINERKQGVRSYFRKKSPSIYVRLYLIFQFTCLFVANKYCGSVTYMTLT